ncbi:MAG TPA: DUF5993 family protein [Legionella sp.]|nr:DUF5993 family protein [Legionella sp.]
MIILLFLLYFALGLQIAYKPNETIKLQFVFCLLLTLVSFNFHSHLIENLVKL